MTVTDSIKSKLNQAAYTIRLQTARIAELEAENERLKARLGAHATLRLIYSDPNAPQGNRIKAAASAISYEVPKLMPEPRPLELAAEPVESLEDLYKARLEREDRILALPLAEREALLDRRNGGSGSDADEH